MIKMQPMFQKHSHVFHSEKMLENYKDRYMGWQEDEH